MPNLPKISSEEFDFIVNNGRLNMTPKMIPYDVMQSNPKREDIVHERLEKVIETPIPQINDSVSWLNLIKEYIRQDLINYILNSMNGVKNMNNDLKTTLTGVVTGILSLLGIFGILIPTTWVPVIVSIGIVVLGYFTNKQDKP